ncbi:MAG: phenylacetate-CoA oxygenase subunit PaaC [Ardenticatenaceae bacterium]|nr:phenylacetate-CoA oxygenase subunit PaaC [Ardenticatenaceae bacterium]
MNEAVTGALTSRLTALADDELILAQRNSEWTGHAPILEEDIALANIAQDELGHATVWLGLLEPFSGRSPDEMAFFRDAEDFLNVQMVELPKGDWAFTMLRQYLFDAYEHILIEALLASTYQPLADAAAKFRGEEMYHLRHTHLWVERLGLGTDESNRRMQDALDILWPAAGQLFVPLPDDHLLVHEGIFPDLAILQDQWVAIVRPHLTAAGLTFPAEIANTAARGFHTEHMATLLADMQLVARWEPDGEW